MPDARAFKAGIFVFKDFNRLRPASDTTADDASPIQNVPYTIETQAKALFVGLVDLVCRPDVTAQIKANTEISQGRVLLTANLYTA